MSLIFIIIKIIYKDIIKYAHRKRIDNKINIIAIYSLYININNKKEVFTQKAILKEIIIIVI